MKRTMFIKEFMLFCIAALFWGCQKIKEPSLISDDPYAGIILPETNLVSVTLIETVDYLLTTHKMLRKSHMEACGSANLPCSFFPGLHFSVQPLSKQIETKKVTIRLSNCTFTQAFKEVSNHFNLNLSYRDGCFILVDPNYNPTFDSIGDPFNPVGSKNSSARKNDE